MKLKKHLILISITGLILGLCGSACGQTDYQLIKLKEARREMLPHLDGASLKTFGPQISKTLLFSIWPHSAHVIYGWEPDDDPNTTLDSTMISFDTTGNKQLFLIISQDLGDRGEKYRTKEIHFGEPPYTNGHQTGHGGEYVIVIQGFFLPSQLYTK
jgi:hypothetical protein